MRTLLYGVGSNARRMLQAVLRERGHAIDVCDAVEEAWAVYERTHPPVVVLAHVDAASLALSRRIRAVPDTDTMIVAVPVRSSQEQLRDAYEAGVDDCLSGGVDTQVLGMRFSFVERIAAGRVSRVQTAAELRSRVHQQAVVAEIGRRVLAGTDLETLMAYAARGVLDTLDVTLCQVLEYIGDEHRFVLRANAERDAAHGPSVPFVAQARYTLHVGVPVIVQNVAEETRFAAPAAGDLVSGISVVLAGTAVPYGVLCAYATHAKDFHGDDVHFFEAVANALAVAIEQIRAERALRESEARARAILDTTVGGVITIEEFGYIESFNQAAEVIFGYDAGEVIGENVNLLMPSPYREEHDGYLRSYRTMGHHRVLGTGREVIGCRKDGTAFPMELTVSEVHLGDRRIFTVVVRDITERRRLEQKILNVTEQERQRIGRDLHDGLGQMLTGIGLLSQNLARRLEALRVSEAETAAEITELVKQADQYARDLARGFTPVDLEASGLVVALRRLAANARRLFDIECTFDEIGAPRVYNSTTATHLYRIAQEAVSNAVRHGRARVINIRLAAGHEQVRLRIQDDGIGFPKEVRGGEGMGVRIMNYRARIIGAVLEITSNLGGGTAVTCTLPRGAATLSRDEGEVMV